jgi:uncharacterized protein (TIGR00106 family)
MLAEFSIVPMDKGPSLSEYVAPMLDIIDRSGLDYVLAPMGTVVEGEPDEIWALLRRCHEEMARISKRVLTTVRIDEKKGGSGLLLGKIESVEKKLGRKLRSTK